MAMPVPERGFGSPNIAQTAAFIAASLFTLTTQVNELTRRMTLLSNAQTHMDGNMQGVMQNAGELRRDLVPGMIRAIKTQGEAVRALGRTHPDFSPTTVAEWTSYLGTKALGTAGRMIGSPILTAYKAVTLDLPGTIQYGAVSAATYVALPRLADKYVPYVGDGLRYCRSTMVEYGLWSGKESAKFVAKEAWNGGKEYVAEQAQEFKSTAQEKATKIVSRLPFMGPRVNPQEPLTTAQRAAQGLDASRPTHNSGSTPGSGSTHFNANPAGQESDLFPLLTLVAGVGLLYFATSKLSAYWESQRDSQKSVEEPTNKSK